MALVTMRVQGRYPLCLKEGGNVAGSSWFGSKDQGGMLMKCLNCGSERIEVGVAWGKSMDSGNVGPTYRAGLLTGVIQAYSDLCLDCGSLFHTYIKESTDKKWRKKPGVLGSK